MADVDIQLVETSLLQDSSPENFLTEMAGLVYSGQWEELISFFAKRQKQSGDGVLLLVTLFTHPNLVKDYQNLTDLCQLADFPINSPFHIYLWFFSGCYLMRHGEITQGKHIFQRLNQVIAQTGFSVEQLPYLNTLKNTADQFFGYEEVEQVIDNLSPVTTDIVYLREIEFSAPINQPLYMAACNQVYFDRYAQGFIEAFKSEGPVLIHVVNGELEKLNAFAEKNKGRDVVISTEKYTGVENSPFYASLRFMRAAQIMEKFDRDLVIADVDTALFAGLDILLAESRKGDAGIFRSLNIAPWYTAMATGIYFKNSDGGKRFLQVFDHLLRSKMENPTWYVDQSVLFSTCAYFEQNPDECHIRYLRQEEGFYAQDIFKPKDGEEIKADIRIGVDRTDY